MGKRESPYYEKSEDGTYERIELPKGITFNGSSEYTEEVVDSDDDNIPDNVRHDTISDIKKCLPKHITTHYKEGYVKKENKIINTKYYNQNEIRRINMQKELEKYINDNINYIKEHIYDDQNKSDLYIAAMLTSIDPISISDIISLIDRHNGKPSGFIEKHVSGPISHMYTQKKVPSIFIPRSKVNNKFQYQASPYAIKIGTKHILKYKTAKIPANFDKFRLIISDLRVRAGVIGLMDNDFDEFLMKRFNEVMDRNEIDNTGINEPEVPVEPVKKVPAEEITKVVETKAVEETISGFEFNLKIGGFPISGNINFIKK